jgi:hypothetical protein
MNRLHGLSAAVVCVGVAIACGGGSREATAERENTTAANAPVETDEPTGRPAPISVTGCLTAADGRYVLTELSGDTKAPGSPAQPTTETYQLTNADEELRPHVGKQVRVNGEAEPARVADVRESTPTTPAAPAGTAGQQSTTNQPAVSTETRTRLETRTMSVTSVTPTGDDCPTGTAPSTAPGR